MNVLKTTATIASFAAALAVTAVPAHAQRGQGPCREDIQKFCAGIQPGGGRYRDCLQQHAAELSPACQQHIKDTTEKVAAWRQACQADVQKLCSDVTAGHGNILKCLHQHEADVSQPCKDQLGQRYHRRGKADATPAQ